MKSVLRERARSFGFDQCRFTSATPPETAAKFQDWLAQGCHGEMAYLARNAHKRCDPQQVLADAKSIITLAVNYYPQESASYIPSSAGVVARYARHRDYHDLLGERLELLVKELEGLAMPPPRSLWYVDTGPLLERDLAQRAGLGFVGKHTNLISRELGNWVFLCEIITTAEFEPDPPEHNHCGSCTRCISACPTQAIVAPFRVDARRCISYLTIEFKGSIPPELRPALGNRIYGCDDCLAVCPWNRFAREANLMRQVRRADLDSPDLIELLSLDDAQFKLRFRDTPLLRTKRRGLLRNVCVALGNVGTESVLPALERAARDPEPLIAEHALWAIEQIRSRSTQRPESQRGA